MKEVFEKIRERLEEVAWWTPSTFDCDGYSNDDSEEVITLDRAIEIVNQVETEYAPDINVGNNDGWIPCSERLPESENKYGWVSCIVSVIRTHYPTSSYDICDSPYDENLVMHANYHVPQKIWHLECDEQLNALMDIEDAPLNGDYVIAWQPLPEPYKPKGEK